MKYILVVGALLFAPFIHAYNPMTIGSSQPFAEIAIPMDETGQKQSYLGTLKTYPHLYEFLLEETTSLEIQTRQRDVAEGVPVNLILLSVNPDTGRIAEIVRLNSPLEERTKKYNGNLGISLIESEVLELELDPGLYRLEVSTPLNQSPYELDFGLDSTDNSYFGTFSTIWQVQQHFGYWPIQYLFSTYILYQLGIIILLVSIWYTWRKRKKISHAA